MAFMHSPFIEFLLYARYRTNKIYTVPYIQPDPSELQPRLSNYVLNISTLIHFIDTSNLTCAEWTLWFPASYLTAPEISPHLSIWDLHPFHPSSCHFPYGLDLPSLTPHTQPSESLLVLQGIQRKRLKRKVTALSKPVVAPNSGRGKAQILHQVRYDLHPSPQLLLSFCVLLLFSSLTVLSLQTAPGFLRTFQVCSCLKSFEIAFSSHLDDLPQRAACHILPVPSHFCWNVTWSLRTSLTFLCHRVSLFLNSQWHAPSPLLGFSFSTTPIVVSSTVYLHAAPLYHFQNGKTLRAKDFDCLPSRQIGIAHGRYSIKICWTKNQFRIYVILLFTTYFFSLSICFPTKPQLLKGKTSIGSLALSFLNAKMVESRLLRIGLVDFFNFTQGVPAEHKSPKMVFER